MYQYFFNNLIVILYWLSGYHFHIFAAGDEARRVQWIDNGKNSRLRRFQSFRKKSCKKSPTNRKFVNIVIIKLLVLIKAAETYKISHKKSIITDLWPYVKKYKFDWFLRNEVKSDKVFPIILGGVLISQKFW